MVKSKFRSIGKEVVNRAYNDGTDVVEDMEGVTEGFDEHDLNQETPRIDEEMREDEASSDIEDDNNENSEDIDIVDSEEEDFVEKDEECDPDAKTLGDEVYSCKDDVLLTCASACVDRDSQRGFMRRCSSMPAEAREHCISLFNYNKYNYSTSYICNICGAKLRENDKCCKNEVAKYIRLPFQSQLKDVVLSHFDEIMTVREGLRSGNLASHNLSADLLRQVWESEKSGTLILSLLGSVDGIKLNGNTKNKLWPVSFALLDLKTASMQKAMNMILAGVIECPKDPSTFTWNAIIDVIYGDARSSEFVVRGIHFSTVIQSFVADQPAKRKFFGMRAHQSSLSCFYCLAPGTFRKVRGPDRQEVRGDQLTENDSLTCSNGFSYPPSKLVEYLAPYDTPVDILHNAGEGLLNVIMNEMLTNDKKQAKTDSFLCDSSQLSSFFSKIKIHSDFTSCASRRNGTDKINYFRILFSNACLAADFLVIEQRIVCLGLAMLMTQMYTNCEFADGFYEDVCDSLIHFFEGKNEIYLSIKSHELLYHLPRAIKLFGNSAALSTFGYETFYKFLFGDFKTTITRNFVETVSTRLMLHVLTRREVMRRFNDAESCTEQIQLFVANSPDAVSRGSKFSGRVVLCDEDILPGHESTFYFSTCRLSVGRLVSRYAKVSTSNDVVFYKSSEGAQVGRFIAAASDADGCEMLLIERIAEVLHENRFAALANDVNSLEDSVRRDGSRIIGHLKSFKAIIQGKPSGVRELISLDCVNGVGSKTELDGVEALYVQLNGCPIHS